jgi:hypothetical protein
VELVPKTPTRSLKLGPTPLLLVQPFSGLQTMQKLSRESRPAKNLWLYQHEDPKVVCCVRCFCLPVPRFVQICAKLYVILEKLKEEENVEGDRFSHCPRRYTTYSQCHVILPCSRNCS